MTITIKDIAKKADVSIATVSRVMNNKAEEIRPETRDRVLQIIKQYDYKPSTIARSMITKKTSIIGLIIPDIRNPFFPELVRGVEDFSNNNQYSLFLCNTDGDVDREKKYLNLMREKNVDGLIYTYAYSGLSEHIDELMHKNKIPTVLLDRRKDDKKYSGVYIDNEKAGYIATKHLIDLSHTRIGCITGSESIQNSKERLKGYVNALKDSDLNLEEKLVKSGGYQLEGGYKAAKELLTENQVTAIFAFNDLMAFGVYQAAAELGVKIPNDLSVVGFDNIKYNRLLNPGLTTIEQSSYKMGEIATELLLNQIKGGEGSIIRPVILEPKLIIRESSKVLGR